MNTGRKNNLCSLIRNPYDSSLEVAVVEKRYEEYAYVLDFLPYGRTATRPGYRAGAVVQLIGEAFFTLLEATVKDGLVLKPHDRIYVGKARREKITYIIGRVTSSELTANAKLELLGVLERMVLRGEQHFVKFFNKAQAMTPRMHAIELIPGIGKKYMWQIINERERKPFASFRDLQTRANIPEPSRLIAKRIVEELDEQSKYRLFTRAH